MSDAPMLQIGGQVVPEGTFIEVAEALQTVLEAGFENHAEQSTIQEAIRALGMVARVEHVTVTNSMFTNKPDCC